MCGWAQDSELRWTQPSNKIGSQRIVRLAVRAETTEAPPDASPLLLDAALVVRGPSPGLREFQL
jgi:hypothetical protein